MYTVTNSIMTVLPMGQGACNLIEIYGKENATSEEKLVYLGMVDCGGDNFKDSNGEIITYNESYEYLKNIMLLRGKTAGMVEPYLDCVILTHRDKDHHDKFKFLDNYIMNTVIE